MIDSINLIVIWKASWLLCEIIMWVIWVVLILWVLVRCIIFIVFPLSILSFMTLSGSFFYDITYRIIWLFIIVCWSVMYFWTFKNILFVLIFLEWFIIGLCFSSKLINQMDSEEVKKAIWIHILIFLNSKSKPKLSVQFLRLNCFIYKRLSYN